MLQPRGREHCGEFDLQLLILAVDLSAISVSHVTLIPLRFSHSAYQALSTSLSTLQYMV